MITWRPNATNSMKTSNFANGTHSTNTGEMITQIAEPLRTETNPVQTLSPRGRFFTDQTFHFETLRNAGYTFARCADLGEMLETTKQITEGDLESWYTAWAATADRVEALAERTQD